VTILFGANDASDHRLVPLDEYEDNLALMINQIGREKVVLISPAPVNEKLQDARSNKRMEMYRNKVAELAESYRTDFLDLWSVMNSTDYEEMLEEDGLHFNEKAYALFSRELLNVLNHRKNIS
jgi:lysophospholipase L1-like esterase